jgi:hypothetical protein
MCFSLVDINTKQAATQWLHLIRPPPPPCAQHCGNNTHTLQRVKAYVSKTQQKGGCEAKYSTPKKPTDSVQFTTGNGTEPQTCVVKLLNQLSVP